jgi:beta-glucosidase
MERFLKNGIGQITRIGGALNLTPSDLPSISNKIQKFLVEETRLGIPAIMHEECLCGYTTRGATIFPQIIGIASTWEPDLVEAMTSVIRKQMRIVGAHQGLSPVLDIGRDPRWGRIEETFGEDPYLVSRMGVSYVKGLQGETLINGIIATGKHFLGYGLTQGGRNWGPSLIPKRELLEVFARPFEAAIQVGNIGSIMNSYSEIDGLPCGFSYEILTKLLRDQLKFDGLVVSDYGTIALASKLHGITSDMTQAAILAINAGLDIELPTISGYSKRFVQKIKKEFVSEKVINRSVIRILTKKFELGLFENPYVEENPEKVNEIFNDPEHKELAYKIAQKSIVLLKNDNLLPLNKNVKSITVIGPNADSGRNLLGDYTFVSQFEAEATNITGYRAVSEEQQLMLVELLKSEDSDAFTQNIYNIKTILEAIKDKVSPSTEVNYLKGCDINSEDKSGFKDAVSLAKNSEYVIIVLGEKAGLVEDCTSGESRDRASIKLPGVQEDLIKEVYTTGVPIILVLINGRPLSIKWEKEHIPAIIEGWFPGEMGGKAISDVIFGDYNPGGKLPISFPRHVGQIPLYHYGKPTGNLAVWTWNYVNENTTPLFPFGYGLSYTRFEYSNLVINKPNVEVDDVIEISVDIKNIGEVLGEEIVQIYLHDREASVTRPLEELFGFKRIKLEPDEFATIKFKISVKQLGFYNDKMEYVVEPGLIDVYIGSIHAIFNSGKLDINDLFSHRDVKLKGKFKIIGSTTTISEKRFFSDVEVKRKF